MNNTIVYLIRHSEPTPKSNLNIIKNTDSKQVNNEKSFLSVSGEKKAEKMSKCDELKNLDAVYSSNYVRALGTAKYLAQENNTVINVDERLGERVIGDFAGMDALEFHKKQATDFNFKLNGGESLNETKKRMVEAMKNILMFEAGNRVAVVSHSTALATLLSAWCEIGHNYDEEMILSYKDKTIVDGSWRAPMVFKIVFDGMNVLSIDFINFEE